METGNGTAGNGDEHEGPDRCSIRMHVSEVVPEFGHRFAAGQRTETDTKCHDNQTDTEYRIDSADDLIDGNKGCD